MSMMVFWRMTETLLGGRRTLILLRAAKRFPVDLQQEGFSVSQKASLNPAGAPTTSSSLLSNCFRGLAEGN